MVEWVGRDEMPCYLTSYVVEFLCRDETPLRLREDDASKVLRGYGAVAHTRLHRALRVIVGETVYERPREGFTKGFLVAVATLLCPAHLSVLHAVYVAREGEDAWPDTDTVRLCFKFAPPS